MTTTPARDRISVLSREYVGAPIAHAAGVDPTGDVVGLAFLTDGVTPSTFTPGIWETIDAQYWAVALIGPGSTHGPLAVGRYWVWIKFTDNPEVPVLRTPNRIIVF